MTGVAAQVVVATGIPAFQPFVDAQKALGPHRIDGGDIDNYNSSRALGVTNRTDLDFGAVPVPNIFDFRQIKSETLRNFDDVPGHVLAPYQLIRNQQYTDELQITGEQLDGKTAGMRGTVYPP